MRLIDIFEEKLDEVNMSPGALADFAKTPFAQSMTAGFEAELVIPDAQGGDDGDIEPDYDADIRCTSTQDIRDFFQGDYNGRRDVDRAIEQIDEEFFEYADEKIRDEFEENEQDDMIREILKDNGKTPEEIEEIMSLEDKRYNRDYQNAYEQAWEDYRDGASYDEYVRGFFRLYYPNMSDVANSVNLDWPAWTNGSSGEGETAEEIARDIASNIGMPVKASGGYHGTKRGTGFFILEPDSSIESDDGEAGLELVSPPMPLAQCLEYLDKVFAWADSRGCRTNSSTGFHMGISIPDQSRENVDHLKFTLFLGDDYVLKQFGRESNSYAKSMMKEMTQKLKNLSAGSGRMDAEGMLRAFKDGLNSSAAKFVKTSLTTTHDRYVTVNIKDKYIEVRSAGGDYLGDLPKIKNTLLRYVRAMGLAADPEAEKQEYAKKLYKFLSPMVRGDEDIIKYFTQFSAGTLPSTALKSFIRQAQMKRKGANAPPKEDSIGEGPNLYRFIIQDLESEKMHDVLVRGTSRRDAMATVRGEEGGFDEASWNIFKIEDVDVTDNSAARAQAQASALSSGLYRITNNEGGYIGTITSDNAMDAYTQAYQRLRAAGLENSSWRLIAPGGRQIYPDPAFGPTASNQNRRETDDIPELPGEFVADPMANAQTYIIKYIDPDGAVQRTAIDANSADQARQWFQANHPRTYNITDVYRHTA